MSMQDSAPEASSSHAPPETQRKAAVRPAPTRVERRAQPIPVQQLQAVGMQPELSMRSPEQQQAFCCDFSQVNTSA